MVLSFANFEGLINQAFEVPAEQDGKVFAVLHLREVTRLPHGHPNRLEPFFLIFEGPLQTPLEQGMVFLKNDTIGEEAIFLVPVGAQGEVRTYQAIFN